MDRDRLGRRRQPGQERGLRPMHPLLPVRWISRALRVAMSDSDWARFEAIVRDRLAGTPTQARAYGEAISRLMDSSRTPEPGPHDWMDWERDKAMRLLRRPQGN